MNNFYYIKIGFKNTFRKYKNLSIIFITSFLIITQNTMDSFLESWKKSIIFHYGNMQIAKLGYFDNKFLKSSNFNIQENINFKNDLESILIDNILSVSKNISLNGILSTNTQSTFVSVSGYSPNHPIYKKWKKEISNGAIIGYKLAKFLNIKENETLTLMSNSDDGFPNAIGIKISKIYIFGNDYADSSSLIVSLNKTQELLMSDKFTKYIIHIKDDKNLNLSYKKVKKLSKNYQNLEAKRWFNIDANFKVASGMFIFLIDIIGYFLWIVMFIVMVFISFLSIQDNTKEIGALKTVGISNIKIISFFLTEGITIALIGIILGLMIGYNITNVIYDLGLPFIPPQSTKVIYIRPLFIDSIAFNIVLATFIISVISWSISIISLLRIPVIKAFRYD
jgi:ABC-type lipoprotein release transport system permease subunit